MTFNRTWVLSAAVATLFLGGATVGDRSPTEVAWTTSLKSLESDMGGIHKKISASLRDLDEAKTDLRQLDLAKRAGDEKANESKYSEPTRGGMDENGALGTDKIEL